METMIDIHTHITPNVDDGSASIEMSLEMLRIEAAQGCAMVFLTPHGDAFEWGGPKNAKRAFGQMKKVQEEVLKAGIPIRLFQGCEIYTTRNCIENILQNLKSGRLPSMNRTRYILAEFSVSGGDFAHAKYCLNRYLEEGWIPIIAHAERYCRTFASVENIHALKEAGCLVQVNYYDLAEEPDHEIRTCAQNLLQAELVDMMGSDAHRTDHRAPKLARGAKYIKENCRAEYAENVLRRNAERLLMGTQ